MAQVVKNSPANAGDIRDVGLTPGSGRFPGEGNGNPLQYSCLGSCMDGGAWRATVHRAAKRWMRPSTISGPIIISIWHMRTLRHRQMETFASGHITVKWESWNLNLSRPESWRNSGTERYEWNWPGEDRRPEGQEGGTVMVPLGCVRELRELPVGMC